jgi:hypothetical protein
VGYTDISIYQLQRGVLQSSPSTNDALLPIALIEGLSYPVYGLYDPIDV